MTALVDELAALRAALEAVLDYWEPCDVDVARDYCIAHHNHHCGADEAYREARELLHPEPRT